MNENEMEQSFLKEENKTLQNLDEEEYPGTVRNGKQGQTFYSSMSRSYKVRK